jgi:hypothetical protein
MSERTYLSLPINADEGFPQAFRLTFNGRTYQFLLYVNLPEAQLDEHEETIYELPQPGAFIVLRVVRETLDGPVTIFQRKLVPHLEYEAAELALIFDTMRVARLNLNGVGAFGSQLSGRIAARWAS